MLAHEVDQVAAQQVLQQWFGHGQAHTGAGFPRRWHHWFAGLEHLLQALALLAEHRVVVAVDEQAVAQACLQRRQALAQGHRLEVEPPRRLHETTAARGDQKTVQGLFVQGQRHLGANDGHAGIRGSPPGQIDRHPSPPAGPPWQARFFHGSPRRRC
ncbi:hypothetical protein WR25_10839 [Diploscapter pachys]|uniref:Uncharacterized protein n=1 Tax=Diploscapter pachys TaxID=2018661 RepID=A0A2A2K5B4_9BILA|nr:hypothetical protein WR25_10839 [Diploscapter pachys]